MYLGLNPTHWIGPGWFPSSTVSFWPLSEPHTWTRPSWDPVEKRFTLYTLSIWNLKFYPSKMTFNFDYFLNASHYVNDCFQTKITCTKNQTPELKSLQYKCREEIMFLNGCTKDPAPTWKFQLNVRHISKLFGLTGPPPGNSNHFCGGSVDIFWNCSLYNLENYNIQSNIYLRWHTEHQERNKLQLE